MKHITYAVEANKTNTVSSSNRPNNIPRLSNHLALSDKVKKFPSGPIIGPRPGPTLDIEVAAADTDVIKSKPVNDRQRVR